MLDIFLELETFHSSQLRQRYKEIRPDKPVYLYCQSGARSARAAMFLKKKEYTQLNQLTRRFRGLGQAKLNLNNT